MCENKRTNCKYIESRRKKLKKQLENHIRKTQMDRQIYEMNKKKSREESSIYLSIAIDGADFQRYGLPYFHQVDKDSDRGFKNPIRTVASIVHGHGNMFFTFPANLPSDSNSIIHCLHEALTAVKMNYIKINQQFPSILFLQVIDYY